MHASTKNVNDKLEDAITEWPLESQLALKRFSQGGFDHGTTRWWAIKMLPGRNWFNPALKVTARVNDYDATERNLDRHFRYRPTLSASRRSRWSRRSLLDAGFARLVPPACEHVPDPT